MGADVPIWVEVEVTETRWVKTFGVCGADAIERVSEAPGVRITGNTCYIDPLLSNHICALNADMRGTCFVCGGKAW